MTSCVKDERVRASNLPLTFHHLQSTLRTLAVLWQILTVSVSFCIPNLIQCRAMEALRQYTADKIAAWQVLIATCKLTPRLQKQIQSAINIYYQTANQPNLNVIESGKSLLALRDLIEDHWKQIYENSSNTACLFGHIVIFRMFLQCKLLEDYAGTSYVANENIVCLSRCKGQLKDRERAARELNTEVDHLDNVYQQRVVFVLDELMLDRAHVESKMRAALTRDGQPGSDIQTLIDRCDWANLAAVLRKDQLLSRELFSKGTTQRKIQRGISRIQKKYFRELISSSKFVISKFANNLSIRLAQDDTTKLAFNHLALTPPPYSDICQGGEGFSYDEKGHEKAFKTVR